MSTTYAYEIVSVDQAARCMEVVYTSEGNPTLRVGARLPFEGESLEAVVAMYAPLRYWDEQKLPLALVQSGVSGIVVAPVPAQPTAKEIAINQRNALLAQSDWTQLQDSPFSSSEKSEWAVYRQALRDITLQPTFPEGIAWPAAPGGVVAGSIAVTSV